MRAIISDVHSNLEALQAVLADVEYCGATEVYCLGDVVGYGPNPLECIDLVMQWCQVVVLGNHDQGAIFAPKGFNGAAERAIYWTREQLELPIPDRQAMEQRWEFLGERPRTHKEDHFLFVHGSPRNPVTEYIFPEDVYKQAKMERLFALVDRYCFHGHTHVPGVFTESMEFLSPDDIDHTYQLGDQKALLNVGSVGQPRDGDPRACYVLLDGDMVYYRRIEYDLETTIQKIYAIDRLDNFLGDRLRQGR